MTDQQVIAQHASTIAELRSEARGLYAALRASTARLSQHEQVEGAEKQLARFRSALERLGALEGCREAEAP